MSFHEFFSHSKMANDILKKKKKPKHILKNLYDIFIRMLYTEI